MVHRWGRQSSKVITDESVEFDRNCKWDSDAKTYGIRCKDGRALEKASHQSCCPKVEGVRPKPSLNPHPALKTLQFS